MVQATRLLHEGIRPLPVVVGLLRDLTRSREQLIAENSLLRQQLIVASRKVKRPVFKPHERGLMVLLSRIVRGWRDAVLLVKPETILRWHREGFRLFWKLKSRQRKPAESKISAEQIALIRQMALENRLWKPNGSEVSFSSSGSPSQNARFNDLCGECVLQRCRMGRAGRRFSRTTRFGPAISCRSMTSGFDRCSLPLVIDIKSRKVIHVGVTRAPTEQWTAQQLRKITPFGEDPDVIIRDNDSKFGAKFDQVAKGAGMEVMRTAVRAPLMKGNASYYTSSVLIGLTAASRRRSRSLVPCCLVGEFSPGGG